MRQRAGVGSVSRNHLKHIAAASDIAHHRTAICFSAGAHSQHRMTFPLQALRFECRVRPRRMMMRICADYGGSTTTPTTTATTVAAGPGYRSKTFLYETNHRHSGCAMRPGNARARWCVYARGAYGRAGRSPFVVSLAVCANAANACVSEIYTLNFVRDICTELHRETMCP